MGWMDWTRNRVQRRRAYRRRDVAFRSMVAAWVAVVLGGCAETPPLVSSPLPEIRELAARRGVVAPGDVLVLDFYRNPQLESEPYTVSPGDVVRVDVIDHPELSRERVLVLPDGHISVANLQRLRVVGLRVDEISEIIARNYNRSLQIRDPKVTVSVEKTDERIDKLLGDTDVFRGGIRSLAVTVSESGSLDLPFVPPVTPGKTIESVREEVRLAYDREFNGKVAVTVNLRNEVAPVIYVMGEVTTPGAVPYSRPLDPLMAVAAAGGFLPTAERTDVRVFRLREDQTYDQWAFNMRASLEEGVHAQARLLMEPRDVVYVRKTGIAMANDFIKLYFRNMLPINVGLGFSYRLNPDSSE